MRLRRLRLRNYGSFAGLDLRFTTEPGRITLVSAPNGAGKSVLRRAFHDLLFDIPLQSPMRFRHGYPGMALHAEAVDADGAPFGFGWDRGGKPQRVTDDPDRFARLRAGVTPLQLESLFALDTDRLRRGGTDLKGGATLAEALLAGTGELASAKAVRATLDARRAANWGKGRSRPPLNAAATRLDETRKRVRDTVERPVTREREEGVLRRREEELDAARARRAEATAETRRLHRIALTRPHLLAWRDAEAWLEARHDAPALPPGLDAALAEARTGLALAAARHQAAAEALEAAQAARARVARDEACLPVVDRLARLPGMLGEAEKARKDMGDRRASLASRLDAVRAGLRAVGAPGGEERAAEVIPTVALKAELQAAVKEEAGLLTAAELARAALTRNRAELARTAAGPPAPAPLPDGLPALLDEIRGDRNPATHADEVASAAIAAAAETRRSLARMPGWPGTAEALRAVPLPPEGEFERLDAARTAAAAAAGGARRRRTELEGQVAAARAALAELRGHDLPDAASLAAARAERDRGLRLVLARFFGTPPSPAEEAAFAGAEPVPLVLERRVRDADAVADRRTAELARVGEAEQLARTLDALAGPLREAAAADADAERRQAEAEADWARAVSVLGLGPLTAIGELRGACAARLAVAEALSRSETALATEAALARKHGGWADRLAALLGTAPAPLAFLLATADGLLAASRNAAELSARRQATAEAAERAIADAARALAEAEAALGSWRHRWARLLRRFGRPPDESSAAVLAVLDSLATLEQDHRDGLSLAGRIQDMQADLDGFAATVSRLAQELGHPVGARDDAATTAAALIARARAASLAEAAWEEAGRALNGAVRTEAEAADAVRTARTRLAGVVASCGATDAEGAEARIAASRAHADRTAQRDAARARLTEFGDGLPFPALWEEAESVPAGEMAERREAAEDAATAAQAAAEALSAELNATRDSLDRAAASTDAVEARADQEAATAAFERLLDEQLVLHLASSMLGGAMRTVEEATGGSALRRASAAFAAVTDGAYTLQSHDGPAGEELFAVERGFPDERKALPDLSEGTRDQLYLALRMEALRGHCRSAMPLPFVADDILQTFDDGRARAALRALCDLSHHVQVIVLTHHAHLREVAASVGPGRVELIDSLG